MYLYPLIPEHLRQILFQQPYKPKLTEDAVKASLEEFGCQFPVEPLNVDFTPVERYLKGRNIKQIFDSFIVVKELAARLDKIKFYRQLPHVFQIQPGWTAYTAEGSYQVDSIPDNIIVFDCETYVAKGALPIIASAVSETALYIWLHPCLCSDIEYSHQLIRLGKPTERLNEAYERLLIGHFIAYDRARIAECYQLTDIVSLDTLSMHQAHAGFSGRQRWANSAKKAGKSVPRWAYAGAGNSLVDVFNFYCGDLMTDADKAARQAFLAPSLDFIKPQLQALIRYAALDAIRTGILFSVLWPKYRESCPAYESLQAALELSRCILPVKNWGSWVLETEALYQKRKAETKQLIKKLADRVLANGPVEGDGLDWTPKGTFIYVDGKRKRTTLPAWYKTLNPTLRSRVVHQMAKLKWLGYPLEWHKEGRSGYWRFFDQEAKEWMLPYNTKASVIFSKTFAKAYHEGILTSDIPEAQELLKTALEISYWTSVRKRVFSQIAVSSDGIFVGYAANNDSDDENDDDEDEDTEITATAATHAEDSIIVPAIAVHGTSTRRMTENLWLTVCNPQPYKLGSELKAKIHAPKGYKLIYGDMSSQELRLAAMIGDSLHSAIGCSPMSYSVYAGNKTKGTDTHSLCAKRFNIARGYAKNLKYALIYGAGVKTLRETLREAKPDWSIQKLDEIAKEYLLYAKGKKVGNAYVGGTDSDAFTMLHWLCEQPAPRTPVLGALMPAPLRPENAMDDFATSRLNWTIQSSAVDQLHLFVVAFNGLCREAGLQARQIWAYHDEYVCIAPENEVNKAAELFNIAHFLTWARVYAELGFNHMPVSGSYFDEISIDGPFRKNVDDPCATVSFSGYTEPGIAIKPYSNEAKSQ
jgi:DNA polymerase gamma 1